MSLNYTKKTVDHFLHPQNIGRIKDPDGYAQIGNMVCGDQLDFYLKVEKGKIKDVKFLSFGCASNIATASVMTEKVKGMSVDKAKKFDWNKIVSDLGGLPQQKIHCSIMAVQGLQEAIADYEARQEEKIDNKSKKISKSKKVVKKKLTKKKVSTKKVVKKKERIKKKTKKNK